MYWLCDRNFSNLISKCIYVAYIKKNIKINIKYMSLNHPSCSLCTLTMQDDLYNSYCRKQSHVNDVLILHFLEYKPHPQNSTVFKSNKYFMHLHHYMLKSELSLHKLCVAPCSYIYYLKCVMLISEADKRL